MFTVGGGMDSIYYITRHKIYRSLYLISTCCILTRSTSDQSFQVKYAVNCMVFKVEDQFSLCVLYRIFVWWWWDSVVESASRL